MKIYTKYVLDDNDKTVIFNYLDLIQKLCETTNKKCSECDFLTMCPKNKESVIRKIMTNFPNGTEDMITCRDCKYLLWSDCYPECQKNIQRWNIDLEGTCAYAEKKNQKNTK